MVRGCSFSQYASDLSKGDIIQVASLMFSGRRSEFVVNLGARVFHFVLDGGAIRVPCDVDQLIGVPSVFGFKLNKTTSDGDREGGDSGSEHQPRVGFAGLFISLRERHLGPVDVDFAGGDGCSDFRARQLEFGKHLVGFSSLGFPDLHDDERSLSLFQRSDVPARCGVDLDA